MAEEVLNEAADLRDDLEALEVLAVDDPTDKATIERAKLEAIKVGVRYKLELEKLKRRSFV